MRLRAKENEAYRKSKGKTLSFEFFRMGSLRRHPVYLIRTAGEFYSKFKISETEFIHAVSFPCFVVEMLLLEDEFSVVETLSEMGFRLFEERSESIDLSFYGVSDKSYWRTFLFLSEDEVERLSSVASGERTPELIFSISDSVRSFLADSSQIEVGGKRFDVSTNPLIMGVLNITPDSFYERSRVQTLEIALERAAKMVEEGADILDVGGQSTRPGSEMIPASEELKRVIPVVSELKKAFDVPVSVDTFYPEVAEKALEAGASLVNDIFGFRFSRMLELLAREKVSAVLMHMKGESPKTMQENPYYSDVIAEISAFFNERLDSFEKAGGEVEKLILDPGIGFGKRYEDNLEIIESLSAFKVFGLPILIGHSRKSFIGLALEGLPPEERLEGTLAAGAIAVLKGASILRVHDVKEAKRASRVAFEIKKKGIFC